MKTRHITRISVIFLFLLSLSPQLNAAYDPSRTVFNFQKQMAERGVTASQFKLGLMFETGSGTEKNIETAISWHKKAAEKGYKPAQNRLTYIEIQQQGFSGKHKDWLKSLKNDARFNEGEALFLLGQMYAEGVGVNKSLTKSLKMLHKAAAANIPGSEAEINRVEIELNEIQKRYLTEQQATRIKEKARLAKRRQEQQAAIKAAKAAAAIASIKPAAGKVSKPRLKPVKKATVSATSNTGKRQSTTRQVTRVVKKPDNFNQSTSHKPASRLTPINSKVETVNRESNEDSHPMDMICSGHNFLSFGCR